jgi:DNA-binding IclR family transcriptional regulator
MVQAIPRDVAAFLARHIDSVPQLEALLLLWESAGQAWPAPELQARLYIQPETVQAILAGLVGSGLVELTADGYRFPPESPQAGLVSRVAAVYRSRLVEVAGLIHSKASLGLREFARAFRIKKES